MEGGERERECERGMVGEGRGGRAKWERGRERERERVVL